MVERSYLRKVSKFSQLGLKQLLELEQQALERNDLELWLMINDALLKKLRPDMFYESINAFDETVEDEL